MEKEEQKGEQMSEIKRGREMGKSAERGKSQRKGKYGDKAGTHVTLISLH